MHVSCYDTNTGWKHCEFKTGLAIGPDAALEWVCEGNKQDNLLLAPLSYYGPLRRVGSCLPERDNARFILSAITHDQGGWREMLVIFSESQLPDDELQATLGYFGC